MRTPAPDPGQFEHLLERDLGELGGVGHEPRIGGEHAVDVGVDLAHIRLERRRQRHGRRVGPSTTEGRDLLRHGVDTLEACDDDDLPVVKTLPHPMGPGCR